MKILRVFLSRHEGGLKQDSAILVDQLRAVDNKRLIERKGSISKTSAEKLTYSLKVILDLDW